MRRIFIFKIVAAVWALTFFNVGIAQGQTLVDLTIHLEKDTWLSDLSPERTEVVGKLKLTGYVKGADIYYLGHNYNYLEELDLSEATFFKLDGDENEGNLYASIVVSRPGRFDVDRPYIVEKFYLEDETTVSYGMFRSVLQDKDCDYGDNVVFARLKKLILPDNITTIETYGIGPGITIEFRNNPNFVARDGLLLSKDETELIAIGNVESCVVPSTVKEIPDSIFNHDHLPRVIPILKRIDIPASIERIGVDAFRKCSTLSTVTFTNNGTKAASLDICSDAFRDCAIESLQLPDNTRDIGRKSFYGNEAMQSAIIKSAVCIGDSAFYGNSLTSLLLPDKKFERIGIKAFYGSVINSLSLSAKEIGDSAFYDVVHGTVSISADVEKIGKNALFSTELEAINVDSGNLNYSSEDGVLYNKEKSVLYVYPCAKGGSYVGPASLLEIMPYAFYLSNCESVSLPNVKTVGESAFYLSNCESVSLPNVKTVGESAFEKSSLISANLPKAETIGANAFYGNENLKTLSIPLVTQLPDYALAETSSLESLDMKNVVSAGNFGSCGLETLVLGENFLSGVFDDFLNLKTIYSYNPVAPTDVDFGFLYAGGTPFRQVIVYVPKGSFTSYYLTKAWGELKEIIEMDDGAVSELANEEVKVYSENGKVMIDGCGDARIEVYGVSGQLVYSGTDTAISVPARGIYIVRVAGQTFKVAL